METFIVNASVITPFRILEKATIRIEDESIVEIGDTPAAIPEGSQVIDAQGRYASPGFIDIHVHGGGGASVMEATPAAISKMRVAHAKYGTTSFAPTTVSAPIDMTLKAIRAVRDAQAKTGGTNILGVHLEGPFLSLGQSGAQDPESIIAASPENYMQLLDEWDGVVMMGAAPEIDGGLEIGRELRRRGITASVAHSDATYDQIVEALENGYTDVTHIYSGCSMTHRVNAYRVAGVVEAGLNLSDMSVQVIGDGKHLPPALLRHIYRCKGADRISLITDGLSCSATDLPEGTVYKDPGGLENIIEDGVAKLLNRQSFAGSIATMNRVVRNMVRLADVPLTEAVKMATYTPAKVVKASRKGVIAPGMDADIILFDQEINVSCVIIMGRIFVAGE